MPTTLSLAARSCLEQGCDGQCGDAPVAVRDEVLEVNVTRGHSVRVDHGDAVQRLHGRKTNGRLG